jgi:ATP-binding protein involved in chromosome partitioning
MRGYFDLPDATASDIAGQLAAKRTRLRRRMSEVRHTVAIMSGKGGVGKSVITASLAAVLASEGLAVGVVDADIEGPSMARLLGVPAGHLRLVGDAVEPGIGVAGVKVMSMDLLLNGDESPVEWSGPERERFLWRSTLEANAVREFLADTEWGRLDYLLLDLPPGTGSITAAHDLLPGLGGAIAVTLPTRLSRFVVAKSLTLARRLGLPLIGYVENMTGYACPGCGQVGPLFDAGEGEFAGVPRLVGLPFDPVFGRQTDAGRPDVLERPHDAAARAVRELAARVRTFFEGDEA